MSNPNQEIIESRLASYVDGELEDAGERLEIEQHLQQNPQYRRMLDDLRHQRDMLRALPREAAPFDLGDALNGQLERSVLLDTHSPGDDGMRIPAFGRILAAAAILLLTVGLAAIVYFVLPNRSARTVALTPPLPAIVPTAPADKSLRDTLGGDNTKSVPQPAAPQAVTPTPAEATPDAPAAIAMMDDRAEKNRASADEKGPGDTLVPQQLRLVGKRMAFSQAASAFPADESRATELNALAKSISHDPRVRDLLASGSGPNTSVTTQPALPTDAWVIVVRPGDAGQVRQRLSEFFARSNIDWQHASRPVELALNTTLSEKDGERPDQDAIVGTREIDPAAVETGQELAEQKKQSPTAELQAKPAASAAPAPAPLVAAAAAPQFQAKTQNAAPTLNGSVTGAAGKSIAFPTEESNVPAHRHEFERSAQAIFQNRRSDFAANTTPIDTLYVARRLTPQQARELSAYLAQSGNVRQASTAGPPVALQTPAADKLGAVGGEASRGRTDQFGQKKDESRPAVDALAAKPQATFGTYPTTKPAADGEKTGIVNVVIVLQSEGEPTKGLIAAPATQPAPAAVSLPATQPK